MKKAWKSLDYSLLLPLILLCVLGVIMVYSSSSVVAIVRYKRGGGFFFVSQLKVMIVGVAVLMLMYRLKLTILKKRGVALLIYVVTLLLLTLVWLLAAAANGATAWLFGIQPSEFVKVAVIIVTARFIAKKHETQTPFAQGAGPIGLYVIFVLLLVYLQNDLGTDLLIFGTVCTMIFCSGIFVRKFLKRLLLTSPIWVPFFYFIAVHGLSRYQLSRFTAFANPFTDTNATGFHLINSFLAIADGGLQGLGLGNSVQKLGYLPEPHTDFIMAIIAEELGVVGVTVILFSLLAIVLRAFQLAKRSDDPFQSLVAIGIGSMIGIQAVVNIGGITGMMPLTGVPVPFISYGGSSLLANFIAMGILLNISARVKRQEEQATSFEKPKLSIVK